MEIIYVVSDQGRAINSLPSDAVQQCTGYSTLGLRSLCYCSHRKDGRDKGLKKLA